MSDPRATRQIMVDALNNAEIAFPPKATVSQIRPLYDELLRSYAGAENIRNPTDEVYDDAIDDEPAAAVEQSDVQQTDVQPNDVQQSDVQQSAVQQSAVQESAVQQSAVQQSAGQQAAAVQQSAMRTPVDEVSAQLEAELKILRMRREMLALHQEIRNMEAISSNANHSRRNVNFDHLENALNPFSGKNHCDIRKWFDDFEQYTTTRNYTPDEKYMGVRRLLRETAKDFLSTMGVVDYDELKEALVETFGRQVTYRDIYRQLEHRRIDADESCLEFVISMKSLAAKISIPEAELVTFIIDGFDDDSANITLINDARTISELLSRLDRYQEKRDVYLRRKSTAKPGPSAIAAVKQKSAGARPKELAEVRCFNCSKFGHYKSSCTKPPRPANACFICNEVGHFHHSCPKAQRKHQKIVAAVTKALAEEDEDSEEELAGAISAMQTRN